MSVTTIDPNNVNIYNGNYINGIPPYEEMYIDVSLSAERRDRSILEITNTKVTDLANIKYKNANFLGFNQNSSDNEYKYFTTNYYDGSTNNKSQLESFGIESIKIVINSSFIPQVNIRFVDIRGLSFFNQENSPYRMIFDFPPPIFKLRVKGYYGKTVEYLLHLVKYTNEFKAENGNFYIDADFVAITFAPLSDVLFRYVVNIGMLGNKEYVELATNKENIITTTNKEKPANTFELISRTKQLYSIIDDQINNSPEITEINNLDSNLKSLDDRTKGFYVSCFSGDEDKPIVFQLKKDNSDFKIIQNKDDIIKIINQKATKTAIVADYDIYIGYVIPSQINFTTNGTTMTNINNIINNINVSNRPIAEFMYDTFDEKKYVYKKVSDHLIDINKQITEKTNKMSELKIIISSKVNDLITKTLNITPTIYNIFSIILNDVDKFFNQLRTTSKDADKHHNESPNKNKILGGLASHEIKNDHIYAFPDIVGSQTNGWVAQQILVSPQKISDQLDKSFPEMDLVYSFLETFANQQTYEENTLVKMISDDGSSKWIPNTPLNSAIYQVDLGSDYVNAFDNKNDIKTILQVLLNRFYVVSQYANYQTFFSDCFNKNENTKKNSSAAFYGRAEAVNIALSLNNKDVINTFNEFFKIYNNSNLTTFFEELGKVCPNYNTISDKSLMPNGNNDDYVCIDKNNDKFVGCRILDSVTVIDNTTDNAILNKFLERYNTNALSITFGSIKGTVGFDEHNMLVFKDYKSDEQIDRSLFLLAGESESTISSFSSIYGTFLTYIINIFKSTEINLHIKSFFMMSCVGNVSLFEFNVPGIWELPKSYLLTIGCILDMNKLDNQNNNNHLIDTVKTIAKNLLDNTLATYISIFIDMCIEYITGKDKETLINYYESFMGSPNEYTEFNSILDLTIQLYDEINETTNRIIALEQGGSYYNTITKPMMERKYLVVDTNRSFYQDNVNTTYYSIKDLNAIDKLRNNTYYSTARNVFFENFLSEIKQQLSDKLKNQTEKEKKIKSLVNDVDIINQTYYSFKKIHDKWLTGGLTTNQNGYPFNGSKGKLIDSFVFVDRAMNPIGDTIINPEILLELFDDPNATLLTVISRLLSENNFEFFPLQNFMLGNKEFQDDGFRIDTSGIVESDAYFICMLIGGYSQYTTNDKFNGFNYDGINNLTELGGLSDFQDDDTATNDSVYENNTRSTTYKKINAFKVNFGTENQSMFTDFKVDCKEFPETNESIQILSNIVNDGTSQRPIPKGQNLYNLYQNRAYSSTITGLGNAMIQPTQYYEINNIPLYSGVYLILSVEHTINANTMKTSFTGTKVAKYPQKRVTEPYTLVKYSDNLGSTFSDTIISTPNYNLGSPFESFDGLGKFTEFGDNRNHQGVDIAGNKGTKIIATHDGKLTVKENLQTSPKDRAYGKYVIIENSGDDRRFTTLYAHLSSYTKDKKVGDTYEVKKGNLIGYMGNTGGSTGTHLHFGLLINGTTPVDPKPSISASMAEYFNKQNK